MAKSAHLVAVKVLDADGLGSMSTVVSGYDSLTPLLHHPQPIRPCSSIYTHALVELIIYPLRFSHLWGRWLTVLVWCSIQWAVNDAQANGRGTRSVINISISGFYNQAINDAVQAAVNIGMTVAVAAGNNEVCPSPPLLSPRN